MNQLFATCSPAIQRPGSPGRSARCVGPKVHRIQRRRKLSDMPVSSPIQPSRRAFIADTTALILFFTTTGIFNERFIAGMTWGQVFHARLLGAVLMVPVGRPYGIWRDWIMQHARPDRLSQLLWDSLALVSFQVPIYAAIIAVTGASGCLSELGQSAVRHSSGWHA